MTPRVVGLTLFLSLSACASDPEADAGTQADALPGDALAADTGLATTPCGAETCAVAQFCQVRPNGPCTAVDGGACASGEEACVNGATSGCTPARSYACEVVPQSCAAAPSCPCLINTNPCPGSVLAGCRRVAGQGFTVECPYP